jgi:hypothetical protein
MGKPVFIDLHCHPGLKSYLTASREKDRTSCWKYIDVRGPLGLADKVFLGNMFDSNSSLSQLDKGNVSIAVVGLYAYERAMVKRILNKLQGTIIINRFPVKQLDYSLLQRIASKKQLFQAVQGGSETPVKIKENSTEVQPVKEILRFRSR